MLNKCHQTAELVWIGVLRPRADSGGSVCVCVIVCVWGGGGGGGVEGIAELNFGPMTIILI